LKWYDTVFETYYQKTDMPDNGHHLQVRSIIDYWLSKNLEKIRDILCN
jgi:hypothetical protein